MNFPNKVIVTDQEVDISHLGEKQKQYYISLTEKLIKLYRIKEENRLVVSLSGPSGSGKSVTAAILEHLISSQETDFVFHTLDLDAFHLPNEYLEKKGLKKVKGRYDTYDIEKLNQILHDFTEGYNVTLPIYSRKFHEPIEKGFTVGETKSLLFLVGLWFLRDDEQWKIVRKYISYNLYVMGPQDKMRANTISRHIRGGRSEEDAKQFYKQSDSLNTNEILASSVEPDEVITYYESID